MARSKKKTQAKSRSVKAKRSAKALRGKTSPKKAAGKKKASRPAPKATKKKVAKKPAPKAAPKRAAPAKRPAAKAKTKLSPKNAEVLSRAEERAKVEGLLKRLPPPVAPIVKTLRKVVLEAAPEAVERVEDGQAAYFAGGMFARIEPHERDVLIRFMNGAQLPSAAVLMPEGADGSVTLSSLDAVRESVLRTLVREAVLLNLDKSPAGARA